MSNKGCADRQWLIDNDPPCIDDLSPFAYKRKLPTKRLEALNELTDDEQ